MADDNWRLCLVSPLRPDHALVPRSLPAVWGTVGRRLVVLAAPPGQGKTTVMASVLPDDGYPVVWLGLPDTPLSPAMVLEGLHAALCAAGHPAWAWPAGEDVPTDRDGWAASAAAVGEAPPFHLIVDDVDGIHGQGDLQLGRLLMTWLAAVPVQTVVLLAREPLADAWAGEGWSGDQVAWGPDVLYWAPDELTEIMRRVTGSGVTDAAIAASLSLAGGNLAAAILLGHVPRPGIDLPQGLSGSVPPASEGWDHLARLVWTALPEPLRSLMSLAVMLPVFDGQLCQRLLPDCDVAGLLASWQGLALFLDRTGDGRWQVYAPFARAVRHGVPIPSAERRRLARELSGGPLVSTVVAQAILDDHVAIEALPGLAVAVLPAMSPAMIAGVLSRFSVTARRTAWCLLFEAETKRLSGRHTEAIAAFSALIRGVEGPLRALAIALRAMALQDSGAWRSAHREAVEIRPQLPAEALRMAAALDELVGECATRDGRTADAEASFTAAAATLADAGDGHGHSRITIALAVLAGLRGRHKQAVALFEVARSVVGPGGLISSRWFAAQAQMQADLERFDAALDAIQVGDAFLSKAGLTRQARSLQVLRAAVLARAGRPDEAVDVLKGFAETTLTGEDGAWALELAAAKLSVAIAAGRLDDAAAIQQWLIQQPRRLFADADQFRLRYDLGRLALARGEAVTAHAILEPLEAQLAAAGYLGWQQRVAALMEVGTLADHPTADSFVPDASQDVLFPIVIRCFGGVDVQMPDGTSLLRGNPGSRLRLVVALLLTEPEGVTKDYLFEHLYPDQEVLPKAVAVVMTRLRTALAAALGGASGDSLLAWRDGRYVLAGHVRARSELQAFEQARLAFERAEDVGGRLQAAHRLIELYHGPVFGELAEQPWALLIHERKRRQWLAACSWLNAHLLDRGELAAALDWTDRHLAIDPLSETLHQAKIATLVMLGNRDAVRQHEEAMQRLLHLAYGPVDRGGPDGP
ncbi:MAG: hypothetical protein H7338_04660 [Candidatus Sericytochromatia bacterium]|nr:hypothetical protein [Candidatus Sericytochromatia bacterium]